MAIVEESPEKRAYIKKARESATIFAAEDFLPHRRVDRLLFLHAQTGVLGLRHSDSSPLIIVNRDYYDHICARIGVGLVTVTECEVHLAARALWHAVQGEDVDPKDLYFENRRSEEIRKVLQEGFRVAGLDGIRSYMRFKQIELADRMVEGSVHARLDFANFENAATSILRGRTT